MNKIINWLFGDMSLRDVAGKNIGEKAEKQSELTSEMLSGLLVLKKFRKIKRAVNHNKFSDEALLLLLSQVQKKNDRFYKLGMRYYQMYGFDLSVSEAILSDKRVFGLECFADMVIQKYHFVFDYLPGAQPVYYRPLLCSREQTLNLAQNGDEEIAAFFAGISSLVVQLKKFERIAVENGNVAECSEYLLSSREYDLDGGNTLYTGYVFQTEAGCRKVIQDYYPAMALQKKIISSGNAVWIKTLCYVTTLTNAVWKKMFECRFEPFAEEQAELYKSINFLKL